MWALSLLLSIVAQLLPQHHFSSIPPGNYSGITWMGGNSYAVVSDKSAEDGFFVWTLDIDSVSGEVKAAKNEGFRSASRPNRDSEGIAFNPSSNTIFISGETDNYIKEYSLDGKLTGREIPPTTFFQQLAGNLGLEALSYNDATRLLWTCNESGEIRIQNYTADLKPQDHYAYTLDKPIANRAKAQFYAHGIGTMRARRWFAVVVGKGVLRAPQENRFVCQLQAVPSRPGQRRQATSRPVAHIAHAHQKKHSQL